jgi:hypothetical protein
MKAKNIVVGLRVKVKDSSPMCQAKGKFGTVIGEPYTVCNEAYVQVVIDGVDTMGDCHVLNIKSLKYSNEVAVVGDRIVVRDGCDTFYQKGAGGVVVRLDSVGDAFVKFDSGVYQSSSDNTWCVGKWREYAIIREIKK